MIASPPTANHRLWQIYFNSAATTLHLINQIGSPNLGLTIDLGHALYVGETPAQIVALLADADRLFLAT